MILLFALRFVALYILLIILLSPVLHFINKRNNAPQILVLKDESLSMDIPREGQSKTDALAKPLKDLLQKYREAGYEIHEYTFADGIDARETIA